MRTASAARLFFRPMRALAPHTPIPPWLRILELTIGISEYALIDVVLGVILAIGRYPGRPARAIATSRGRRARAPGDSSALRSVDAAYRFSGSRMWLWGNMREVWVNRGRLTDSLLRSAQICVRVYQEYPWGAAAWRSALIAGAHGNPS